MARQWRCAIVGMGGIGEVHARAISKIPGGVQLVAACDASEQQARTRLDRSGFAHVPLYADQREMMRKESIDVVHVCTPSGDHLNPSLIAIESGASVICEKPLEITLDRIDRMAEAAEKHRVRLAGIFQLRCEEGARAIKNAVVEGRFGKLVWGGSFSPRYRAASYYASASWRGTWQYDGGGAMMNQSIHAVDLLQWYFGPVRQVSAYAANRVHRNIETEDTLSGWLQFESGAMGSIMGSTAVYPEAPARLEVRGEKGTAVWEAHLKSFLFSEERPEDAGLLDGASPAENSRGDSLDPHGQNIQAILSAWSQGREAETSGPEARKAVAIILAMYESAKKNGLPVQIGAPGKPSNAKVSISFRHQSLTPKKVAR